MSERITIDLDRLKEKIPAPFWREPIVETLRECAVRDSPTPPPDDRLDVIFEFATLMEWEPVRYACEIAVSWRLDGTIVKRTLNTDYLRTSDAGASAAAYCWRRGWFVNHFANHYTHIEVLLPVGKNNSERVVYLDKRQYANDHEAIVRAVLAAAKAEKERT